MNKEITVCATSRIGDFKCTEHLIECFHDLSVVVDNITKFRIGGNMGGRTFFHNQPKESVMKRTRPAITLSITSLAEANDVLVSIGEKERAIEALKNELEASIAAMREAANKEIAPIEQEADQLTKSLHLFADTHRSTLCVGDKKSVVLPGGEFGWRLPPTKVTYGKGGAEKAIESLTAMKLTQYLRYTVEVDREALLRDRPVVHGVKYTQKEGFYVKPESAKEPETFPGSATGE
jgi:phage host-nuclease inhibitor protein Gam